MATIGTSRILTKKLNDIKKNKSSFSQNTEKEKLIFSEIEGSLNDNGKTRLLNSKRFSVIELNNHKNCPRYMDLFSETNEIFKEIELKFLRLLDEQHKRITPKFEEEDNTKLDRSINSIVRAMTNRIKDCEENIRKISLSEVNTKIEEAIRDNIKVFLVNKLQQITKKLRINEEEYLIKFKEFCGIDDKSKHSFSYNQHINNSFSPSNDNTMDSGNFLETTTNNEILKKRDIEINNLVNTIHELSHIFKDLSYLVFEQGTVLDRIDYNIEAALDSTKKANKELTKTENNLKSNCSRNSIIFLILIIFVECILLILKFSK